MDITRGQSVLCNRSVSETCPPESTHTRCSGVMACQMISCHRAAEGSKHVNMLTILSYSQQGCKRPNWPGGCVKSHANDFRPRERNALPFCWSASALVDR